MEKKEYTLPNEFGRYNTKIKKYRDGSCTVIYADSDIFLPSTEVAIDDEEFAKSTAVWLGRKKSKARKIDREKFIDGLKESAAKQNDDSVIDYNDKKERIYGGVVGSQSYFIYYNVNYSDKVGLYTIIDDVGYES